MAARTDMASTGFARRAPGVAPSSTPCAGPNRVSPGAPSVALIWAQDSNGLIGDGKKMLWRVPADLRHFKEATLNSPVIMGRASYEALGGALPNRTNVILTRDRDFVCADALVAHSLEEGLELARAKAQESAAPTIWVIGGGQVYDQAITHADELIVSRIDLDATTKTNEGQAVRAPHIDPEHWEIDSERSDTQWREASGDARWRVDVYRRLARKSSNS